jgi:hypothetical protein
MRRLDAILFAVLALPALSAAIGCEDYPTQIRYCIDDQKHIVPDERCDNEPFTGSVILPGSYHYIYGGATGGHLGDTVVGGSWQPKFRANIVSGDSGATVHQVSDRPQEGEDLGG